MYRIFLWLRWTMPTPPSLTQLVWDCRVISTCGLLSLLTGQSSIPSLTTLVFMAKKGFRDSVLRTCRMGEIYFILEAGSTSAADSILGIPHISQVTDTKPSIWDCFTADTHGFPPDCSGKTSGPGIAEDDKISSFRLVWL